MILRHQYRSRTEKMTTKRLVWGAEDTSAADDISRAREGVNLPDAAIPEAANIVDRLKGADGKIASVGLQLREVTSKVSSMGGDLMRQFEDFLMDKIPGLRNINFNTPDTIAQDFNTVLDAMKTPESVEALRDLDRGLDVVLLRVKFRQKMVTTMEGASSNLPEAEKATMRNTIGRQLEAQLSTREGDIDTPINLTQFKDLLEVVHEMCDYATVLSETKTAGATSIDKAMFIPSVAIAYPHRGGPTVHFNHWSGEDGKIYAIDDVVGRVQVFDPGGTGSGANAWRFLDRDARFPLSKRRPAMASVRASISGVNEQEMIDRQRQSRMYIDGSSRNYDREDCYLEDQTALSDAFEAELARLTTVQETLYSQTPGSRGSFAMPLGQMFDGLNGMTLPTWTPLPGAPSVPRSQVEAETPAGTARTQPGAPEAPGAPERQTRTPERTRINNEMFVTPPRGVLNWGGDTLSAGSPSRRVGTLEKTEGTRRIVGATLNGRPLRDPSTRVSIDGDDHDELYLKQRDATDRELMVTFEDTVSGRKTLKTIRLSFEDAPSIDREAAQGLVHAEGVTKGIIRVEDGPRGEIARLPIVRPGVERSAEAQARVVGKDGTVGVNIVGNSLRITDTGSIKQLNPEDELIVVYRVNEGANEFRDVVETIRIENLPGAGNTDSDLVSPENRQVSINGIERARLRLPGEVVIGELVPKSNPNVIRQVLATDGSPHPFLRLNDQGKIVLRTDVPITVPTGGFSFKISSSVQNSTDLPVEKNYVFRNTILDLSNYSLQEAIGAKSRINHADIISSGAGTDFLTLPDAPFGVATRRISQATMSPWTDEMLSNMGNDRGEVIRNLTQYFTIEGNSLKFITPVGKTDIALKGVFSLLVEHKDPTGRVIKTERVTLDIPGAEPLAERDVQIENGVSIDGTSGIIFRNGPISPRNVRNLGVSLRGLPDGSSVEVVHVYNGSRTGTIEAIGGESLMTVDANGQFVLRRGAQLPVGRHFIRLLSNRGGKPNEHWVVIENLPLSAPSQEHVSVMPGTTTEFQLPIDSSSSAVDLMQLTPIEFWRMRRLSSAKIGDQGVASKINFDAESGMVSLRQGQTLDPGNLELKFTIDVPGHPQEVFTQSLTLIPAVVVAPPAPPPGTGNTPPGTGNTPPTAPAGTETHAGNPGAPPEVTKTPLKAWQEVRGQFNAAGFTRLQRLDNRFVVRLQKRNSQLDFFHEDLPATNYIFDGSNTYTIEYGNRESDIIRVTTEKIYHTKYRTNSTLNIEYNATDLTRLTPEPTPEETRTPTPAAEPAPPPAGAGGIETPPPGPDASSAPEAEAIDENALATIRTHVNEFARNAIIARVSNSVYEIGNSGQMTEVEIREGKYVITGDENNKIEIDMNSTDAKYVFYCAVKINQMKSGWTRDSFSEDALKSHDYFVVDDDTDSLIEANNWYKQDAVARFPAGRINPQNFVNVLNIKMKERFTESESLNIPYESRYWFRGQNLNFSIPNKIDQAEYFFSIDDGKTWLAAPGGQINIAAAQVKTRPFISNTELTSILIMGRAPGKRTTFQNIDFMPRAAYQQITVDRRNGAVSVIHFNDITKNRVYSLSQESINNHFKVEKSGNTVQILAPDPQRPSEFIHIANAVANLEQGTFTTSMIQGFESQYRVEINNNAINVSRSVQ